MRKNAQTMLIVLLSTILLTGCEMVASEPVAPVYTPRLDQYAIEFQQQLADEIAASLLVTCPRDILVPDCAAWKRIVVDYGYLRDQIRAAGEPP